MIRSTFPDLAFPGLIAAALLAAGAAHAQGEAPIATAPPPPAAATDNPPPTITVPAPISVQATALRAPDLFSASPGPTGLHDTLWDGASADLARQVVPMVGQKPMSPAASAFARRLLATGAHAPDGAGSDADLAAARIAGVLGLGDAAGAQAMLAHTPGVASSPALSQIAAEADLVRGQEDQACQVGDALSQGKDDPYFRRLRAYCMLRANSMDAAQLAFDLAAQQAKDDVYRRLMGAALAGTAPGAADLRNGLDFALSKHLKLDLTPALPGAWRPVLVAIAADPAIDPAVQAAAKDQLNAGALGALPVVAQPVLIPLLNGDVKSARAARAQIERNDASGATALELALIDAALTTAEGKANAAVMDQLVERGGAESDPRERLRAQQGAALYGAQGLTMSSQARAEFAGFDLGRSPASQSRLFELQIVRAPGDVALLALWLAADAGAAGTPPVERAEIVRALARAGFGENARAFALEGLLGLTAPPPAPAAPPAKAPARREKLRR